MSSGYLTEKGFLAMRAEIWLLPGVTSSMKHEVVSCRENFVTLQTPIVLLPGVRLQVCLQGT